MRERKIQKVSQRERRAHTSEQQQHKAKKTGEEERPKRHEESKQEALIHTQGGARVTYSRWLG